MDNSLIKNLYKEINNLNLDKPISGISLLDDFSDYLDLLSKNISKSTPKEEFVFQWTFKYKFDSKDLEKYYKSNIYSASKSLKRIRNRINTEGINKVNQRILLDFICDLKPYITFFDKKIDYSWLIANTNTHLTTFYYNLANNVFWNGEPGTHEQEKLVLSSSTTFTLRQCVEYKVKGILGIDYILNGDKIEKPEFKVLVNALQNNMKYYSLRNIEFEQLKTLHSWLSYYIHKGIRPEPWKTETAISILKDFFYIGLNQSGTTYSHYSSIEVNRNELEQLMENTFKYLKEKIDTDIEISWISHPEVVLVD
jgi:hypothetical protein